MQSEKNIPERNKRIGYLAPQYWDAKSYLDCPDSGELNRVLEEFKRKAKSKERPCWHVKNACLYFTYHDTCYVLGHGSMDTTPEIFECLIDELEDALYEIGAYDMFYAGMMD